VSSHRLRVSAEYDVGSSTRHVRGDRDGALTARLRDDLGFFFMMFRVQYFMRHAELR
jgi:hypothetical protein